MDPKRSPEGLETVRIGVICQEPLLSCSVRDMLRTKLLERAGNGVVGSLGVVVAIKQQRVGAGAPRVLSHSLLVYNVFFDTK